MTNDTLDEFLHLDVPLDQISAQVGCSMDAPVDVTKSA